MRRHILFACGAEHRERRIASPEIGHGQNYRGGRCDRGVCVDRQPSVNSRRAGDPRAAKASGRRGAAAHSGDVRAGVLSRPQRPAHDCAAERHFITRPERTSRSCTDRRGRTTSTIPLLFAGPAVKPGVYRRPPSAGRRADARRRSRRADADDRHRTRPAGPASGFRASESRLSHRARRVSPRLLRSVCGRAADARGAGRDGAWFSHAHVNVLPSNTAVGHTTISTGTDPRFHGITGNNGSRSRAWPACRTVCGHESKGDDGADACRCVAIFDIRPRGHHRAGQHRPGVHAARRPWRLSAKWLTSAHGRLRRDHRTLALERRVLPLPGLSEGSSGERVVVGESHVARSSDRCAGRRASLGAVSRIRSRRDRPRFSSASRLAQMTSRILCSLTTRARISLVIRTVRSRTSCGSPDGNGSSPRPNHRGPRGESGEGLPALP